jgi:hypothetical protein
MCKGSARIFPDRVAQRLEAIAVGHQCRLTGWEGLSLPDKVSQVPQPLEFFIRSQHHGLGATRTTCSWVWVTPAERKAARAAISRSWSAACSPRETARIASLAWCNAVG